MPGYSKRFISVLNYETFITCVNTLGLIIAFGSSGLEFVVLDIVLPLPGDDASSTEPAAVASLSLMDLSAKREEISKVQRFSF